MLPFRVVNRNILVNGRSLPVSIEPDGTFRAADKTGVVSITEIEPGLHSVLLDGRVYEVRTEGARVIVNGESFTVEVEDPRAPIRSKHAAQADGRQSLASPMPGKVVRVLVTEGEKVEAGQGIVVVEAMKMQNEMKSPKGGRVASLAAREGATVGAGDILAVIE